MTAEIKAGKKKEDFLIDPLAAKVKRRFAKKRSSAKKRRKKK